MGLFVSLDLVRTTDHSSAHCRSIAAWDPDILILEEYPGQPVMAGAVDHLRGSARGFRSAFLFKVMHCDSPWITGTVSPSGIPVLIPHAP